MKEQLAWGMRWWLHLQKGSQTQQFIRIIFFQHAYCSKYRAEGKGSHGPACILNTPPSMVFKAASSRQVFPEMLLFSVLVTIMVHFIVSQSAADIWQLKEMHSFSRGFCISGPNQSISYGVDSARLHAEALMPVASPRVRIAAGKPFLPSSCGFQLCVYYTGVT